MIILSSEHAAKLTEESKAVINLILDAQSQLKRRDVVQFFRANVDAATPLLQAAQKNLKSFPLVIRGLKEAIDSTILPSVGTSDHDEGWLNVGDVFVGWIGYCHDRPYVVTAKTDNQYSWRYIDEELEQQPMRNDPGLRLAGWIKIPIVGDVFSSISNYQQQEIDALQQQVEYFQTNQFAI